MNTRVRIHFSRCGALLVALGVAALAQAQGMGPTPVAVCSLVERDAPASIRLVGTVLPDKSATVAAQVGGPVADYSAREGQFLKAGDLISKIDPTTARLLRDEARERLASLQAQLEELENGVRPEELRRLKAAVDEAQAVFDKWKFERERVLRLYSKSRSNEKERHDTEMDYLAAERRLSQAAARLEMAENGARKEELARARYDVAAQQAVLKRLERDLQKTEIRAPFAGFIVEKLTEIGEWIDSGGAVCRMVAIETVKVRADVPEHAIVHARAGRDATVEVEALGKIIPARIARVIPQAAPAARTFPIEIELPNADHALLPGMFVWAHVPAGPPGRRLMVDKDAIAADGASKRVFVIRPGPNDTKMAVPVAVTTGLELRGEIEIQGAGLKRGDQVVCRANERLFGPTPVVVMGAQPAPPTTQPGRP